MPDKGGRWKKRSLVLVAVGGVLLLGVTAVFCSVGWLIYRVESGEIVRGTDYGAKLNELALHAQPDDPDAWGDLLDIGEDISNSTITFDPGDFVPRDVFDEGEPDLARLSMRLPDSERDDARELKFLRDLDEAGMFDRLVEASAKPSLRIPFPDGETLPLSYFPRELSVVSRAAAFLPYRMYWLAEESRTDEIPEIVKASLDLAEALSRNPSLNAYTAAQDVTLKTLRTLNHVLRRYDLDEQTYLDLMILVNEWEGLASPDLALEGLRLATRDLIQSTHTDLGGGGYLDLEVFYEVTRGRKKDLSRFGRIRGALTTAPREETVSRLDEIIGKWKSLENIRADAHQRLLSASESSDLRSSVFDLDEHRHIFFDAFPWMTRPVKQNRVIETDRLGTLVLLAVKAHRIRHGDVPEALDDLVPEFLDDVPVAPVSGMPFHYRRLVDDAYGRAYVLYSAGLNGSDDGGVGSIMQRMPDPLVVDYLDREVDYIINVIGRSPDD